MHNSCQNILSILSHISDSANEEDMRDVNISPIGLYSYLLKLVQSQANGKGRYRLA